jgi:hypothetical protein
MKKSTRNFLAYFVSFIFGCFATYSAAWFVSTHFIHQIIMQNVQNSANNGYEFTGTVTPFYNFPFKPNAEISGVIKHEDMQYDFPSVIIKSWFIPSTELSLTLPKGLKVSHASAAGVSLIDDWGVDFASLQINVPSPLLHSFSKRDVTIWRDLGGKFQIKHLMLQKDALKVTSHGDLSFNNNLQIAGLMQTRITNYNILVDFLKSEKIITGRQATVVNMALKAISSEDDNKDAYVQAPIQIIDSVLYVGPIRVFEVPQINWDTDISSADTEASY